MENMNCDGTSIADGTINYLRGLGAISRCIECNEEIIVGLINQERIVCLNCQHLHCSYDDVDVELVDDQWFATCDRCFREWEIDKQEFELITNNRRKGWKRLKKIIRDSLAVRIRRWVFSVEFLSMDDIIDNKRAIIKRGYDKYPLSKIKIIVLNLGLGDPVTNKTVGHANNISWHIGIHSFQLYISVERLKDCEISKCEDCYYEKLNSEYKYTR